MDLETMQYYVRQGLWKKERLDKLLAAGKITQVQHKELAGLITGVTP